jgi:hypothetical protein
MWIERYDLHRSIDWVRLPIVPTGGVTAMPVRKTTETEAREAQLCDVAAQNATVGGTDWESRENSRDCNDSQENLLVKRHYGIDVGECSRK